MNLWHCAGRYQPYPRHTYLALGSIFSRKRTSLFRVEEDGLTRLADLPSAGDTSYTGVVVEGNEALISCYTNRIDRDFAWILGMVSPSEIRLARTDLDTLADLPGLE